MQCNIFQVVDVDFICVDTGFEGFCVWQNTKDFFGFNIKANALFTCISVGGPGWDSRDDMADRTFPWFILCEVFEQDADTRGYCFRDDDFHVVTVHVCCFVDCLDAFHSVE